MTWPPSSATSWLATTPEHAATPRLSHAERMPVHINLAPLSLTPPPRRPRREPEPLARHHFVPAVPWLPAHALAIRSGRPQSQNLGLAAAPLTLLPSCLMPSTSNRSDLTQPRSHRISGSPSPCRRREPSHTNHTQTTHAWPHRRLPTPDLAQR